MVSILKVDEIQNPSTGSTVINTKTPHELDCFYVNADISNPGASVSSVIHQWSRANHTANSISIGNFPVGTGLTGPSGSGSTVNCFSFPTPGYYRLDLTWVHLTRNDNPNSSLDISVSIDNGSNYTTYGIVSSGHTSGTHTVNHTSCGTYFINVPSVTGSSAVKFRITFTRTFGSASDLDQVNGTANTATTALKSYLLSQRIGEAVA